MKLFFHVRLLRLMEALTKFNLTRQWKSQTCHWCSNIMFLGIIHSMVYVCWMTYTTENRLKNCATSNISVQVWSPTPRNMEGGIFIFIYFYFNVRALSAAPQIQLCRRMLGSYPGLLRLWKWQPDAVTIWLDLIRSLARSHPHLARSQTALLRNKHFLQKSAQI